MMKLTETAKKLYPARQWAAQEARYTAAEEQFKALFGEGEMMIFSAPGRSEICGNHTDHNLGKAVGASIDLDVLAFVRPRNDGVVHIHSEGYAPFTVDTADLSINHDEIGTSSALVRGIAFKMKEAGYRVGGFDAYTVSNVCKGSGLSSSAAFEVAIACILDHLYNDGAMPKKEMAKISQFAENIYFGKASGLLDQLSCAYGGMIAIDFKDPAEPMVSPLPFDFGKTGYDLIITDVRSDHADLTDDYVAIKSEMQAVANAFGKEFLRDVSLEELEEKLPLLHQNLSERALVRAFHYLRENNRVDQLQAALEKDDFEAFKAIVCASGQSSFTYLQNIYSDKNPTAQAITLALCIADGMLGGTGAWRVHGGGFGGTIQAYVPREKTEKYCAAMERIFGADCCFALQVRDCGPIKIQ